MKISEHAKVYFFAIGALLMFVYMIYDCASTPKFNCDDYANNFRKDFKCRIILTGKESSAGIATLTGTDLDTKRIVNCEDGSKWILDHFNQFNIGDTIIKNQGDYTITIKRKGKTITIPFRCNDKIYRDTPRIK